MGPKTQQAYSSLQPHSLCPNHNTPQIQSVPVYFYKSPNRVGLKSKRSPLLTQLYEQLLHPRLCGRALSPGHGMPEATVRAGCAVRQQVLRHISPIWVLPPDSYLTAGTGSAAAAPEEWGTDRQTDQSWCLSTVKTFCKGTEHAFPSQAANLSGAQQASRRQFDLSSSSTCSST